MLSKLRSLDRSDRCLVLEAAISMAVIGTALRVIGFGRIRDVLDRYVTLSTSAWIRPSETSVGSIRWAVKAAAARLPDARCLVQALTADAMLRRRGVPCELRIGVRPCGASAAPLEAHAWVECGSAVAIGAVDGLATFKVLTTFPEGD